MSRNRLFLCAGLCLALSFTFICYGTISNAADVIRWANGNGTLSNGIAPNGRPYKRQFSFSARTLDDGTVEGNAILHSAFDDGAHGNQPYALQIDISCMRLDGSIAYFGGTTRRTTDPNLVDAVYFSVQDNGTPGADNDKLSLAYFFDDDPNTTGDPQLCQDIPEGLFPMEPIRSGNITIH